MTVLQTKQSAERDNCIEIAVRLDDGSNEILSAYSARDWEAVRLLAALVDSVVSGVDDFASSSDAIAALREACKKLEAKSRELTAEIDDMLVKTQGVEKGSFVVDLVAQPPSFH